MRTLPTVRRRPRPSCLASLRETVSVAVPAHAESQRTVTCTRPLRPVRARTIRGASGLVAAGVTGVPPGVPPPEGGAPDGAPTWTVVRAVSTLPSLSCTVTIGWNVPVRVYVKEGRGFVVPDRSVVPLPSKSKSNEATLPSGSRDADASTVAGAPWVAGEGETARAAVGGRCDPGTATSCAGLWASAPIPR